MRIPTGSAIAVAIATMTKEPANAFASPLLPVAKKPTEGVLVMRSRLSWLAPLRATDQTMSARKATAISAASHARSSIVRLTARRRGRFTARTSAWVMPCALMRVLRG